MTTPLLTKDFRFLQAYLSVCLAFALRLCYDSTMNEALVALYADVLTARRRFHILEVSTAKLEKTSLDLSTLLRFARDELEVKQLRLYFRSEDGASWESCEIVF
jgi:hypothetical protein